MWYQFRRIDMPIDKFVNLTIRKLYEIVKAEGEEFLDVPFTCSLRDQFRNIAAIDPPTSLWDMPRHGTPNLAPGEPPHLNLNFFLDSKHSLRKVKSDDKET
jgi:hypothetical protein